MIKRLCRAFLTAAARRWPDYLRDEMLAEWRAELHAMPGTARRLRYAASLAASRPHREPAVVVRPGRNFAHAVLSLVLIAGLPMLYAQLALGWTFVVTLGSRVAAGLHSPLDILAGAAFGIVILIVLQFAAARIRMRPLAWAVGWTRRHEAAASALLLLCLLEVAIVMQTLQRAREIASATAGGLL